MVDPGDEETSRVALRLVEEPGEDGPGVVRVLLSVTERRLADDLDPWGSDPAVEHGPLADITSAAGLTAAEAGQVFEELVAFARCARAGGRASAPSSAGRGDDTVWCVFSDEDVPGLLELTDVCATRELADELVTRPHYRGREVKIQDWG